MNIEIISKLINNPIDGAIISSGNSIVDTFKPYVKVNLDYCNSKSELTDELEQIKHGCENLLNDKFDPNDYPYLITDLINPHFAEYIDEGKFMLDINYTNPDTEFEKFYKMLIEKPATDIRTIIESCRRNETKIALVLSTLTNDVFEEFLVDSSINSSLVFTCVLNTGAGMTYQPNPHIGNYNLFITNGIDTVALIIKEPFKSELGPWHYKKLRNVCNLCLKKSNKICPCKRARYCSVDCQRKHRFIHKKFCSKK